MCFGMFIRRELKVALRCLNLQIRACKFFEKFRFRSVLKFNLCYNNINIKRRKRFLKMNTKGFIKLLVILFGVSVGVTMLLPLLIPMIIGTFAITVPATVLSIFWVLFYLVLWVIPMIVYGTILFVLFYGLYAIVKSEDKSEKKVEKTFVDMAREEIEAEKDGE